MYTYTYTSCIPHLTKPKRTPKTPLRKSPTVFRTVSHELSALLILSSVLYLLVHFHKNEKRRISLVFHAFLNRKQRNPICCTSKITWKVSSINKLHAKHSFSSNYIKNGLDNRSALLRHFGEIGPKSFVMFTLLTTSNLIVFFCVCLHSCSLFFCTVIEHLPQELRDRFTDMREMDLSVQSKNATD